MGGRGFGEAAGEMRGRWWCAVFTSVLCTVGCGEAQELCLVLIPGNYTNSNTRPDKEAAMFWRMFFPILQSGLLLSSPPQGREELSQSRGGEGRGGPSSEHWKTSLKVLQKWH